MKTKNYKEARLKVINEIWGIKSSSFLKEFWGNSEA